MFNGTGRVSKIFMEMTPNNKFPQDSSQEKSASVHKGQDTKVLG